MEIKVPSMEVARIVDSVKRFLILHRDCRRTLYLFGFGHPARTQVNRRAP
jgi:hypothetical protein